MYLAAKISGLLQSGAQVFFRTTTIEHFTTLLDWCINITYASIYCLLRNLQCQQFLLVHTGKNQLCRTILSLPFPYGFPNFLANSNQFLRVLIYY